MRFPRRYAVRMRSIAPGRLRKLGNAFAQPLGVELETFIREDVEEVFANCMNRQFSPLTWWRFAP